MNEWLSTDTAPRNGTWVLALYVDRPRVVRWRDGPPTTKYRANNERVWFWSDGYFRHGEPVGWMALPPSAGIAADPATMPKPKPRGPVTVTATARRRIVEVGRPKRVVVTEKAAREWCSQCERRVTGHEVAVCTSAFCKAKVAA